MNILLTCAGRRKYLVDYFKTELGNSGRVIGADMTASAPALAGCDVYHLVPSVDAPNYIEALLSICKAEKVDAIVSLNDLELPVLASAKDKFTAVGTKVIVSEEKAINICGDKFETCKFAESISVPAPKTFLSLNDALISLSDNTISYPIIVKPRWGSASIGLYVVNTDSELREAYALCKRILQGSFLSKLATDEKVVLIQEFIRGPEFGVDIFNDLEGSCRGVVLKKKLAMRAGETDKAITIQSEKLKAYADAIGDVLGHIGNLDCDFLERDGEYYLLEMNPRFGGGYPFSHEAGANLVKALLQCLRGESDQISINYKADLTFAKCDVLVSVPSAVE
ncbi:ATP-grasp domain-containing protein [Idiomarina seosinensis]|uniref:ATP-grasp domain-containing protein n=1 Tax=Idiomarina seosinensis TaxID=281739 RepID=UPI00384F7C28